MGKVRLDVSPVTRNVYAGELVEPGIFKFNRTDVTEDFERCIVRYCSEPVEIEVDGEIFKVTCERVGASNLSTPNLFSIFERSAIASMNHLFLTVVAGRIVENYTFADSLRHINTVKNLHHLKAIQNELDSYLSLLNEQPHILKNKTFIEIVETELIEGCYFQGDDFDNIDIESIFEAALRIIAGPNADCYQNISQFYIDTIKRCIIL